MYTIKQHHKSYETPGSADPQLSRPPNSSVPKQQVFKNQQEESVGKKEYKIQIYKQLGELQKLAVSAGYGRMAILFEELQFALASPRDAKGLADILLEKEGSTLNI